MTMLAGAACWISSARHVYQAGSRVGAGRLGSRRKLHPNATNRAMAAAPRTHQLPRRLRRSGSAVSPVRGARTLVSAIRSSNSFVRSGCRPGARPGLARVGPWYPVGWGVAVM